MLSVLVDLVRAALIRLAKLIAEVLLESFIYPPHGASART